MAAGHIDLRQVKVDAIKLLYHIFHYDHSSVVAHGKRLAAARHFLILFIAIYYCFGLCVYNCVQYCLILYVECLLYMALVKYDFRLVPAFFYLRGSSGGRLCHAGVCCCVSRYWPRALGNIRVVKL